MNSFGTIFRISIYGESHGECCGILIDGVKSGIKLSEEDFIPDLTRRKAGKKGTTPRIEKDMPHIMSGVFNGYTTGAPILINFLNENVNDNDYSNLIKHPRPGHCDLTAYQKYDGFNDYRGGGAFSGRLTLGIVCAGVIAKKITNFNVTSEIVSLHNNKNKEEFDKELEDAIKNMDSIGGTIRLKASNVPFGLGEPYFDSCESKISHLLYSIGAVKGVSFGVGFDGEALKGSEFNDFIIDEFGKTKTNNNGGINGGISNGNDIIVNVFVKPTASIGVSQETYNFEHHKVEALQIKGRHDACIALRAPVVLEACLNIALCDLYLMNKALK